jgi:hydrogenase expression/formation protein HypE
VINQTSPGSADSESTDSESVVHKSIDMQGWSCPLPLADFPQVTMAHGGGGKLSRELVEHLFLPAFDNAPLSRLGDAAVLEFDARQLAFSTDSYVVQPLFFPGGCIGDLAVNGTVNDLAMSGARPLYLSAGFILEEGFPMTQLQQVVQAMGQAARRAGVAIVAGDTKVVGRGHGDGCYITTAGVGAIPADIHIGPHRARPGDAVILSGPVGNHGMAIMSVREGLQFESTIVSDTAPLHEMVRSMLAVERDIRVLRDPTRGGLSASLNEIASAAGCGIVVEETAVPVDAPVLSACEILGLDPWQVANEGKLVCIAPRASAAAIVAAMRANPVGRAAVEIGYVVSEHPQLVVARTAMGGSRVITLPLGEQLPRIC